MANYKGINYNVMNEELEKLEDSIATKQSSAGIFVSDEETGTGSEQSIAHGLGVIPSKVIVAIQTTAGAVSIVEGTHTDEDILVTVTSGDTFKVLAFA